LENVKKTILKIVKFKIVSVLAYAGNTDEVFREVTLVWELGL